MTAHLVNWIWGLADQDFAAVIGLGLIGLGITVAILRKIGNWT